MCMITDGHWWEQILEKVYCRHFKFMNLHSGPCWWVPPVSHEFSSQQTFLFQTLSDICWAKFCGRSILLLSHPTNTFFCFKKKLHIITQSNRHMIATNILWPHTAYNNHFYSQEWGICTCLHKPHWMQLHQWPAKHKGAISSVITINPNHNYTLSGYPVL